MFSEKKTLVFGIRRFLLKIQAGLSHEKKKKGGINLIPVFHKDGVPKQKVEIRS